MTLSVLKDVIVFLLAIYGAILSTLNWWNASRKDRRSVQVSLSTLVPTYNGGQTGRCFAKIEAVNVGHRPVTVTTLTVELPNGTRLWPVSFDLFPGFPDTRLPTTLSDGQSAHLTLPYADLADGIRRGGYSEKTRVVPICQDSAGNIYQGQGWDVDPNEFANM